MRVGNDVVDLRDAESQPDALHPRWDSRVFTAEELARLSQPGARHALRWRLWAAKESAFKVARKVNPTLSFFPLAFTVELTDASHALVHHELGRFCVRLEETAEYVHAVASPEGSSPPFSTVEALHSTASVASNQVRDMARHAVAALLDLDPTDLEISSVDGVPVAVSMGAELPVDLSLSHHGRFVACAWTGSGPSRET